MTQVSQPEFGGKINPDDVDSLVDALRAAAAVRLEMVPAHEDGVFVRHKKGEVFYAVDANVVTFYVAPDKTGPEGGYGKIFPFDDRATSFAVGTALARYIFQNLVTTERPALLLPSHGIEARTIYNNIAQQSKEERAEVSPFRNLRIEIDALSSIGDEEERIRALESEVPKAFLGLFQNPVPAIQLVRFSTLVGSGKLRRLPGDGNGPNLPAGLVSSAKFRDAFLPPRNLRELLVETQHRVSWFKRMEIACSRSPRGSRSLRADADALARLEVINGKLRQENARLVLVTGDSIMMRAARNYTPKGASLDFAALYLRSPRSYLTALEVLTASRARKGEDDNAPVLLEDWLDTLLARFSRPNRMSLSGLREMLGEGDEVNMALRHAAESALSIDSLALENIKREWVSHTDVLVRHHIAVNELLSEDAVRLVGSDVQADIDATVQSLKARLKFDGERTWRIFFEALMRAGYDLAIFDGRPRRRSLDAPPVTFGRFGHIAEFIHSIFKTDGFVDVSREVFSQLLQVVETEDRAGYGKAMAYAVLFAHSGRWHVATLLAEHALDIARHLERENDHHGDEVNGDVLISGREALYFLAFCTRILAGQPEDLTRAVEWLEDAEAALRVEKGPSAADFRFEVERTAIALYGQCFRVFRSEKDSPLKNDEEMRSLLVKIEAQVASAEKQKIEWMRERLTVDIVSNFFVAAMLMDPLRTVRERISVMAGRHPEDARCKRMVTEGGVKERIVSNSRTKMTWRQLAAYIYGLVRFNGISKADRVTIERNLADIEEAIRAERSALLLSAIDKDVYQNLLRLCREALDV